MKWKTVLTLICIIIGSTQVYAQSAPEGFAKKVFDLVNMARTQPSVFLSTYRKNVETCSPRFVTALENSTPIDKVIWDAGLASMQKEVVEDGILNPKYPGKMDGFYISSEGSGSSASGYEPIDLLCNFFTVINDPASTHFAIYYKDGAYSFSWGKSLTINSKKKFTYSKTPDLSKVDFNRLNTAKNETYMSKFERDMIQEVNFVRMYPKIYAHVVGVHMQEQSKKWNGLDRDDYTATLELIKELSEAEPYGILQPKKCVYQAAKKHGLDCKERGFIDHDGSDASDPWDRISEYCDGAKGNENIVGTSDNEVRKAVIALLVDGGIASRGHRSNMLNRAWKFIGCFQYNVEDHEYSAYFTIGYCIQNFSE